MPSLGLGQANVKESAVAVFRIGGTVDDGDWGSLIVDPGGVWENVGVVLWEAWNASTDS